MVGQRLQINECLFFCYFHFILFSISIYLQVFVWVFAFYTKNDKNTSDNHKSNCISYNNKNRLEREKNLGYTYHTLYFRSATWVKRKWKWKGIGQLQNQLVLFFFSNLCFLISNTKDWIIMISQNYEYYIFYTLILIDVVPVLYKQLD